MTKKSPIVVIAVVAMLVTPIGAAAPASDWVLWYRQPAEKWVEGLPVGNGRLGAVVFGNIERERIQLNEDTLWAGQPVERDRVGAHKHLTRARRLIFEGKYVEAQNLIEQEFMSERLIRSYQTLGDLFLEFKTGQAVSDYRRQLDLDTAIARVTYRHGDATFTREVFASPVDQAIVVRLTCDKPGLLTFDVELTRPENFTTTPVGLDQLVMRGQADRGKPTAGVKFESHLKVIVEGGKVSRSQSGLHIEKANAVTLLLTAATNYRQKDPGKVCKEHLTAAAMKSYLALRNAHVAEHRRLFRRVDLDLGKTNAVNLPTDRRLEAVKKGAEDPQLIAQYFQFGRYLLISCSRPGCMPSNLQGLWCYHIHAPWNCDYHININIQMNYWPAEVCNLSECHQPFFDLVDNLQARGRKTARDVYGCRGFTAHHTTDAWFWTSPIGKPVWGMWPMGAAWCCRHLWEHYLFTGDRQFLSRRGYPIMKEAAEFCLDFLVEDPKTGRLVSGPSTSPENRFRTADGKVSSLTMGCAMDQEITWDLLTNCLEAARVLGIDDEFVKQARTARSRLAGPKIGSDGRLMEWPEEFEEPDPNHLHMSHLFAVHPGRQITLRGTPKLAAAAATSLQSRGDYSGMGWSTAWKAACWARLEQADRALAILRHNLANQTHPSLFNELRVFQIAGNFGGTAAIAEMLLQSHAGQIALLPAWPQKAWATGHVKGLRARGGLEVDIAWQNGRATSAVLKAKIDGRRRIRPPAGHKIAEIRCRGKPVSLQPGDDGTVVVELGKGRTYNVKFK